MRTVDQDIPVWGDPIDPEAVKQIIRCRSTADWAALSLVFTAQVVDA